MNSLIKLLIQLFMLTPFAVFSQAKVSGTVTYSHNQVNKPDMGADIFIIDSAANSTATDYKVNVPAVDSFVKAYKWHSHLIEMEALMNNLPKRKRTEIEISPSSKRAGIYDITSFDKIDDAAYMPVTYFTFSKMKTKADGVGNYSIKLKPGTYYVLIRSANRTGLGMTSIDGMIYLKKVILSEDDENISHNFEL